MNKRIKEAINFQLILLIILIVGLGLSDFFSYIFLGAFISTNNYYFLFMIIVFMGLLMLHLWNKKRL